MMKARFKAIVAFADVKNTALSHLKLADVMFSDLQVRFLRFDFLQGTMIHTDLCVDSLHSTRQVKRIHYFI